MSEFDGLFAFINPGMINVLKKLSMSLSDIASGSSLDIFPAGFTFLYSSKNSLTSGRFMFAAAANSLGDGGAVAALYPCIARPASFSSMDVLSNKSSTWSPERISKPLIALAISSPTRAEDSEGSFVSLSGIKAKFLSCWRFHSLLFQSDSSCGVMFGPVAMAPVIDESHILPASLSLESSL